MIGYRARRVGRREGDRRRQRAARWLAPAGRRARADHRPGALAGRPQPVPVQLAARRAAPLRREQPRQPAVALANVARRPAWPRRRTPARGRTAQRRAAGSSVQQPTASLSVRQTCAMRGLESNVTRRRKDSRGTVWRLSKLTTHRVGTPSSPGVSSSSDTKPRRVLVRAATTTDPMRSATGSRVNTSTGRSPPGVAANQISPRCIVPVGPILGWTPVCNALERSLGIRQGRSCPRLGIVLAAQADQVPMESVAENLRAVHPKRLRPTLNLSRLIIRHTKAEHRHTA